MTRADANPILGSYKVFQIINPVLIFAKDLSAPRSSLRVSSKFFPRDFSAMTSKDKNYISKVGLDRLLAEIEQLERVERPKVTELVAWAASLGDRSENADYLYGKRRLREIDSRLRFLHTRVNSAEVVNYLSAQNQSSDVIRFGATVDLQDEEGESKIVTVVGVDEIDPAKGKISWRSPLGAALLGKKVGDEFEVKAVGGNSRYTVADVVYKQW